VKLIVMSRTYRQSSLVSEALQERDPANRLYARQSRYRFPAELIRDNSLFISGLLVDDVGGASSRPYQPTGYYAHLNFPKRTYKSDKDKNQYRRGVYVHWQRQFLHPMLSAFDAPTREECTARRPVSNTPSAALVLLNDPTFLEAAKVFAEKVQAHKGTEKEKIQWAWRRTVSRFPTDEEVKLSSQLLADSLEHYQEKPEAVKELVSVGLSELPAAQQTPEFAAWMSFTHALLNLSETITRN